MLGDASIRDALRANNPTNAMAPTINKECITNVHDKEMEKLRNRVRYNSPALADGVPVWILYSRDRENDEASKYPKAHMQ
jgi:hypothetical protein